MLDMKAVRAARAKKALKAMHAKKSARAKKALRAKKAMKARMKAMKEAKTVVWTKSWPTSHRGHWRLWSLESLHYGGDGKVYEEWHGTLHHPHHHIASDATSPSMKAKKAMNVGIKKDMKMIKEAKV
jgi:hypothetical protein